MTKKKSNDPYDQIRHEGCKKYPDDGLIVNKAYEYFDHFDPHKFFAEVELAEVVASLARSYYRSKKYLEASVCLKLLADRLKDQEFNEDAYQFFILRILYEDLGDFEGLIIYCQEMIRKVEAFYAKEMAKVEGLTTRIFEAPDAPIREVPTAEIIQEDLDRERGYLMLWIERAKETLLEVSRCEAMLRGLPAFGGA